jgi:CTP synthase
MVISGTSPDGRLVEFVEFDRDRHPFFVATQAHPELKSRPTKAHPLFAAFVGAAAEYANADQLPVELPEPPAGEATEPATANGAAKGGRGAKAAARS